MMKTKICLICKKEFQTYQDIYCSRKCYYQSKIGLKLPIDTKKKMRQKALNRKHRPETIIKIKANHFDSSGANHPGFGKQRNQITKDKISKSLKKYTELEAIINNKIINWTKWKKFRKEILKRDNYTCKICNKKAKIIHHLIPKKEHPEKCWEKDNVISLCSSCHNKIEPRIKDKCIAQINKITFIINTIWKKHKFLRLCQLIGNCFLEPDNYYKEDNILLEELKRTYD